MNDDSTLALAAELLRYLAQHPGAADTAEGILRWWLPQSMAAHGLPEVEAALEQLVQDGALERRRLPDGRVLYAAAP
jgi:Fe2+ or Zn2+ uptake regulation protein